MSDSEGRLERISQLTRTIAHAQHLGVRAEVCGDEEQKREAERIYHEAMAELKKLKDDEGVKP